MAQKEAILVFCSSCKILDFASSVSPRIIAEFKALKYDWKLQTSLKGNAFSFEWDTQFC